VSAARNLSRIGELTDEVVEIAQSGTWRRYRTAVGIDQWLECELDYFLIACDLQHEDVSRIVAYTKEGASLAPMMDRDADQTRRRPLEDAAAAWHSPGAETLLTRAQRLGWTRSETSTALRAAPLPPRVRARQAYGMSKDQHAARVRAQRLSPGRRSELDELVGKIRSELADEIERLYVIEQLRAQAGRGRPAAGTNEREQWLADAERLGWDKELLAREWDVTPRTTQRRIRLLRESLNC
jgi:hypothetical protein